MLKENAQPQHWVEINEKKESLERPFYELPGHIKPCSKIIQETRRQLSNKGKSTLRGYESPPGSPDDEDQHISSVFASSSSSQSLFNEEESLASSPDSLYEDYFDELLSPSSSTGNSAGRDMNFPSIRPVHTQRPKTGKDHDIWGISSKKRPPSAITLSRLSLDSFEDEFHLNNTPKLVPRRTSASVDELGKLVKLRNELSSSGNSSTVVTENHATNSQANSLRRRERDSHIKTMKQVEEATEQIKGLCTINKSSSYRKSSQPTNEEVTVGSEELLQAVNHLDNITKGAVDEIPLKSDVIAALQQVNNNVGEVEDCPVELKHRLLKLIFKLVEGNQEDEDVIFWASFVLLHFRISGTNLSTVFKMVFKASRSKEYWGIILETEYLHLFMESFGQICPLTQTDSMIYGYGTLKFICMDKSVLVRIFQLNLIPIMTLHLKLLNYSFATKKKRGKSRAEKQKGGAEKPTKLTKIPETIFNGVFQLTSILRSVVGEESTLHLVVTSGLLEELCNSLEWTVDDIDIISNIVRILSVISADSLCCECISSNEIFVRSVVPIIQMWHSKDDAIVRLTYCLGNLLAGCENLRLRLFEEPSCYNMILHLINYYIEKSTPISEDILIKTIRILANWSLNPIIGTDICDEPQVSQILNRVLRDKKCSDELLTCVISTLNNTSFYKDYTSVDLTTMETAQHLHDQLTWKNLESRTEVMKVLGNLTRNPSIREMTSEHVDKILLSLQEEDNEELLCATVGVLMNIIVEARASHEFVTHRGIDHLLHLMQVNNDLALNLMICQFLWNIQISSEALPIDRKTTTPTLKQNQIDSQRGLEIKKLISKKLQAFDQNTVLQASQPNLTYLSLQAQYQSEYQAVAERLLDKLSFIE